MSDERRLPVPRRRARPDGATTGADDHLRDLIEQVLFTAPGERVMRPDFGSGLLGLVFEPGGPELVATTQHLVQGALQQELGHLIAVESVEVAQDDGRVHGRRSVRRAAHAGARRRRVLEERRREVRAAATSGGCAAVKEAGVLNGIEYVEVSDSEAPTPALRQRTLFVRLLQPARGLDAGGERRHRRRRADPRRVERRLRRLPAAEVPALVAGLDDPATVLLVRTDSTGDFSTYTLRLVAGAGERAAARRLRPAARRRSSSRSRSSARPTSTARPTATAPPETGRAPAIDYLAKDYDSLPPADARPAQPRSRRSGRSGRRPTLGDRARRAARLRRRRAVVPAGRGRDRGVPRARRGGGRRSGATRGSSTTSSTRARTRACGCASSPSGEGVALDRGTQLLTRVAGRAAGDRARTAGAPRGARGRRRDVRDGRRRAARTRRTNASTSGRGVTPAAASRAARPRRRSSAIIRS